MNEKFHTKVTKDHLVFSAAHFITFNGNICERLHGHNWRVAAEVSGPLDENYYVFDFIALRDHLQKIVNELDHRVLLPTKHKTISITAENDEVIARFEEKRWVFPVEDCALLPLENTTAERIAWWMAHRLKIEVFDQHSHKIESLRVDVEENFGQWGCCEILFST